MALARLAEVNLAEGEEGYGDGNENEAGESAPYVSWALENGILNRIPGEGSSIDSIMPEQILTRQEAAVILFNYAKATGMVLVPAIEYRTICPGWSYPQWATPSHISN